MKQDPQELYLAVLELLPQLHPSDLTQIELICHAIKTLRKEYKGISNITISL